MFLRRKSVLGLISLVIIPVIMVKQIQGARKRNQKLLLYQALFYPQLLKGSGIQIETTSEENSGLLEAESPPLAHVEVEEDELFAAEDTKVESTSEISVETSTSNRLHQSQHHPPDPPSHMEPLCQGVDGSVGICSTRTHCERLEGINQGNCLRKGFICCKVQKSCHNATRAEVSYFVNPHFPMDNDQASFCDYRVDVTNPDVCQLRLDFEKFSLRGPHKMFGVCRKDRFMVTTSYPYGIGISDLCGENTGQHIYVNVNPGSSVSLMVMTSGGATYMWKMKITQIDCKRDSELVAPIGCLQYYTELSGSIQSFNYIGRLYQANLDYAICIKRSLNTCRVEYNQQPGSDFGINSCDLITHDYLFIPGGTKDIQDTPDQDTDEDEERTSDDPVTFSTQEKFCGRSLSGLAVKEFADNLYQDEALNPPQNVSPPSVVTSYASGPIILRFHSDKVTNKETDIGFAINFQQLGTGCNKRA
ncbi:hypothetical protein M8J76_008477 [Diaphorina citri]|nr:hypothetical protein M8J76_008477 [Diaphorina citri]